MISIINFGNFYVEALIFLFFIFIFFYIEFFLKMMYF